MLETLRAWLNGKREYYTGVALFSKVSNDERLLNLFKKGPTEFSIPLLQEKLMAMAIQLKAQQYVNVPGSPIGVKSVQLKTTQHAPLQKQQPGDPPLSQTDNEASKQGQGGDANEGLPNADLYSICKREADKEYKRIMNLRAELFAQARTDEFIDLNTPDRIKAREKLAIDVVLGYQHISQLYDRAEYVKIHGKLPDQPGDDDDSEYDSLPDHLVKPTLDNLRKNYNKMKNREATAERTALLQKHEKNIKKLEARWLLLKPKN